MATLLRLPQYRTTTIAVPGNVDSSQTTGIILADLPADLDEDVAGLLALTWSNPVDEDAIEYITYTSINAGTKELQGVTRGQEGFSARAHDNGATVAWVVSKSHINLIVDKLTGVDTILSTDSNGNELIKTSTTTSAVNEITVKNAATGAGPEIQATGGDTNIDLNLQAKGTGAYGFKGTATSAAEARLFEDTDNGTNYIGLKAPASVGTSKTFVLPDADGSANQYLKTNGSATLSWGTPGSTDGWIDGSAYTWTYASASTFTIAGVDLTTTFTKGTRLKFTQTTVKYAVVVSSSFSTDTTVTIAVNTDYVIANAAITANYYSYQANPQGYPTYFNDTGGWDLEFGGTNTANTTVTKCKFAMIGKTVHAMVSYTFQGDPGTGALTVTATTGLAPETPFEPKGIGRYWNGSAAVMLQVDFDGTDFIPRGVTGTAMSDTSPSTIANGHDLTFNLTYQVA